MNLYWIVYKKIIRRSNDTLVVHIRINYEKIIIKIALDLLISYIHNSDLVKHKWDGPRNRTSCDRKTISLDG